MGSLGSAETGVLCQICYYILYSKGLFTQNTYLHLKSAVQNSSSSMLPSNNIKQKLAMLALPPGSCDWSIVLELTLMSSTACKCFNSFNFTQRPKNWC